MTKDEVLKLFEQLSPEDQQAVRTKLSESTEVCCGGAEVKERMESMMQTMHSSENPMEHCKQMMEMCQKMMQQKMQPS